MQPPQVAFSYTPENPTSADVVDFVDLSSDEDGDIVSWYWDFGDDMTSELQHPVHQYPQEGSYMVQLTVRDNDGLEETASQTVSVQTHPRNSYVLLAQDAIIIGKNSVISSGDIGVNNNTEGVSLLLGKNVQLPDSSSIVKANTIQLLPEVQIWEIAYNYLQMHKTALIQGVETTTLDLPVASLPQIPPVSPGTTDVKVKRNKEIEISQGEYDNVVGQRNSKLIFTGGVYHMNQFRTERNVQLIFKKPTELRITTTLSIGNGNTIIGDLEIVASDILFYIIGDNCIRDTCVKIGRNCIINANVYSPQGSILIKKNTIANGAFIGQIICIQNNVHLSLDNSFTK
jgi:hypothetical protein